MQVFNFPKEFSDDPPGTIDPRHNTTSPPKSKFSDPPQQIYFQNS